MVSAGVVLAGCGAAVGVAFLSSPPPAYESITVRSHVAWPENESLKSACEQLSDGDFNNAAQIFRRLSEQGSDPAVRLASFLMWWLADDEMSVFSSEDIAVFRQRIDEAATPADWRFFVQNCRPCLRHGR